MFRGSILAISVLAMGVATPASSADEPEATEAVRLEASWTKWEQARKECGGNYSYQVGRSYFSGQRIVTTITVREGKVAERKYEVMNPPAPVKPGEEPAVAKPQWVETGKELGSHKEGAGARTVDELYAEAKKLVAMAVPEHHQRTLGFDKQGLLSHCFLRDRRIADDAPMTGIPPIQIQLTPKK